MNNNQLKTTTLLYLFRDHIVSCELESEVPNSGKEICKLDSGSPKSNIVSELTNLEFTNNHMNLLNGRHKS